MAFKFDYREPNITKLSKGGGYGAVREFIDIIINDRV